MWFSLIHIALLSTGLISVYGSCGEGARRYNKFRNEIRAVVAVTGKTISGNVIFKQDKTGGPVTVTGIIKGLSKGKHGFHVHEKGDLSGGCATAGPHYNPDKKTHGGPTSENRHVGDLGNIEADDNGIAWIRIIDNQISLSGNYNIIGRAVVVHADPDDLGLGGFSDSTTTGHAGARLGCGVINNL